MIGLLKCRQDTFFKLTVWKNEVYPVFYNAYVIFVARSLLARYGTVHINPRHQESMNRLSKLC